MRILPSIREAVIAKQSLRVIHDTHGEALGIGYVQFTRYVKTFVTGEDLASAWRQSDVTRAPIFVSTPATIAGPSSPLPLASCERCDFGHARREGPELWPFDPRAVHKKDFI